MQGLLRRSRGWVLALACGGSLLALNACDPTVRDTVLQGVGTAATGLVTTFIQAFIQSLSTTDENVPTTVQATDDAPQVFA
jgi:putative exporter of polyketide antibiotics